MNYKSLDEMNKAIGSDIGSMLELINNTHAKSINSELCPTCGDCNKECDNCAWCNTDEPDWNNS